MNKTKLLILLVLIALAVYYLNQSEGKPTKKKNTVLSDEPWLLSSTKTPPIEKLTYGT